VSVCLCECVCPCICAYLPVCVSERISVTVCTVETAKFEDPEEELKKEDEFPSLVLQLMCDMFGDNNVQKSADSTIRIAMDNCMATLDPFALVIYTLCTVCAS